MLKKISLVTIGNTINSLLGFIFLWAVANTLPIEEFGKYALFVSILLVFARLTDFGTNSTFVTKSIFHGTPPEKFLGIKAILSFIALTTGTLALKLFGLLSLPLFLIYTGSLMAYILNYVLYAFYQKEEAYSLLVLLYTIPAGIKATAAPLLFLGILPANLHTTTGVFGLSIASGLILVLHTNPLRGLKIKFGTAMLKEAWPAGFSQILTEMWPAFSNAIAKSIEGFADVGVFALANKVSVIFSLFSLSIFTVLLPKNAKRKKQDLKYSFDEVFILSGAIIVMGFLGIIAAKFVVSRFFGAQFERSIGLLEILIFAAAFNAIAAFMENYFFIQEDTVKILTISMARLGTFLLGILVLVPSLKLEGLAYAQLAAGVTAVLATGGFIFSKSFETIG